MPVLIVARGIQGLGVWLMILSMAIIADIVPPRNEDLHGHHGQRLGFASCWAHPGGGSRTASLALAFWFNLPLGAFAIAMAAAFLKMPAQRKTRQAGRPGHDHHGSATTPSSSSPPGRREYEWSSPLILGSSAQPWS